MKKRILFLALIGAMSSALAQDATYDARSLGMGGVGVAAANGLNAAYQNPSLLSGLPKEKVTVEFPIVAVRLLDEGELKNNLDTLNINATTMNNALSAFDLNPTPANATQASAAINNFSNSLDLVSGKSLTGSLFGGTMLAIPRSNFAFALKLDGRAEFGGLFNYSTADRGLVTGLATNLSSCAGGTTASCTAASGQVGANGTITGLTSDFQVRGAVIGEVGLTAARHFDNLAGVDLGITPKFMRITSFDMSAGAQSGSASATSRSGNQKTDSAFNLDLGASKLFKNKYGHNVRTGLVAKNIISKSVKTALGNAIEIAPQVTAGVAYGTDWFTGSADLDVIKNKPLVAGMTKESQFVRLGAEFDAKGWAQLRVGYRHDLSGNYAGLPSVGVALFHVVDLSIAYANKKEAAAALQFGFHF